MNNKQPIRNKLFSVESIPALIIGTIIAFLVGKIFDPILTYLYSIFLNIGGGFIKYISDSTYLQISNGFSEQSSMLALYMLYLASWGFIGYIMSSFQIANKLYMNQINDLEQKLNMKHSITVENPDSSEINSIELMQESIEDTKNSIQSEINSMRKKRKKEFSMVIIVLSLGLMLLVFAYTKASFINKETTILTNNIEIVSPYITDSFYKKLKSDFHSMKNSDDYNNLVTTLTDIANENSIILKK